MREEYKKLLISVLGLVFLALEVVISIAAIYALIHFIIKLW